MALLGIKSKQYGSNAAVRKFTGDGITTSFHLNGIKRVNEEQVFVFFDGNFVDRDSWVLDSSGNIVFDTPPSSSVIISVNIFSYIGSTSALPPERSLEARHFKQGSILREHIDPQLLQNLEGTRYEGLWPVANGLPPTPEYGFPYYRIQGDGQIGSEFYKHNDFIIWDGPQGWGKIENSESTTLMQQEFTNIAGTTTINFDYDPNGRVDVYYNGIKLSADQYTATNGSQIVLADAVADAGDIVTIDSISYLNPIIIDGNGTYVFNTVDETQSLAAGQTTVNLSTVGAMGSAVYVRGPDVDGGRLIETEDYTITDNSTIELVESYPSSTVIMIVRTEVTA